jgi:hypothetical protein
VFARISRPEEGREFLVNLDHVSLIEVEYWNQKGVIVPPVTSRDDPNLVRHYVFQVGDKRFRLSAADPSDPAIKVLSDIYNNALKT